MKRLYTALLAILFMAGVAIAVNWVPQGMVVGTRAQGEAATSTVGEGDLYVYDDVEVDGDLNVAGTSTLTGAITITGVATLTDAPVSSSGEYGYTTAQGSTIYTVEVATTIAANGTYTFSLADGKAGTYTIHSGTHTTSGTFTSAAAVSISTVSSADLVPVAVTDGGSAVLLTNGAAATKTYYITYKYVN